MFWMAAALGAQSTPDGEAVRRAALDYVEGFYEAKFELIERSVHPEVNKRGFWFHPKDKKWVDTRMSWERMKTVVAEWSKGQDTSKFPKEVTLLEVKDQTAVAKVVAEWGQDYLLLGKFDGKWKITQVIWQSLPAKSGS